MSVLHLPWLELAVLMPLIGAAWIARQRDPYVAQKTTLVFSGLALLFAVAAWIDFAWLGGMEATDRWSLLGRVFGGSPFSIDELAAPLLPMAALVCFVTSLATLRTKLRRYSFAAALVSESILLATFCSREPWGIIALLGLGVLPPLWELRSRGKPLRVYLAHMGPFVVLLAVGWALADWGDAAGNPSILAMLGVALLIAAVLIRSGIVPMHCWMTDLFEHATFGTALLFVTPMVGVYAAVRLLLPIAPEWALRSIALISLFTAVYASGMALVEKDARRFFCYLLLSHSSLVLVGLEIATPIGLTGALWLWLSVGLALSGFGLTLRSIEARTGPISLREFHGLYEHTPTLAVFFLITGLASIGFPGTIGFVGSELLVEGVVNVYPLIGMAVVAAAALNGIAVLQAYFKIFTGRRHVASISLASRMPERIAVLTLALLLVGGGLFPQPSLASRHQAALRIIESRGHLSGSPETAERTSWWFAAEREPARPAPTPGKRGPG